MNNNDNGGSRFRTKYLPINAASTAQSLKKITENTIYLLESRLYSVIFGQRQPNNQMAGICVYIFLVEDDLLKFTFFLFFFLFCRLIRRTKVHSLMKKKRAMKKSGQILNALSCLVVYTVQSLHFSSFSVFMLFLNTFSVFAPFIHR